jgi:DnaK suppressor protein
LFLDGCHFRLPAVKGGSKLAPRIDIPGDIGTRKCDVRNPSGDNTMAKKLTEQDILNWHGDDYMNEDHLAFFRQRLLDMKQELLENANATSAHLQEQEATPDPADRATLEEEYALELRTRDRERKLLLKIDATIKKIDEGDYGYCDDTGEPIGLPRLLARPTASLTVEAQERRERMKKQFAD